MKYMPFDAHFHITTPRSLMPERWFAAPSAQNARNLVAAVDALGLSGACIPSITLCDPADLASNPLALYAKTLAPGRIWALCGMRWDRALDKNIDMAAQARALLALGFDGVKMICKPNARKLLPMPIDGAALDGFFAAAEREGWPILFHVGDPATFWDDALAPDWAKADGWYYGDDPSLPSLEDLYAEVGRVLEKHPRLNVTFAHFLFLADDLPRAEALLARYPNARLDVTPGREMYAGFTRARAETKALLTRYAGRILFGTDNISAPTADFIGQAREHTAQIRRFFETEDEFLLSGLPVRGIGLPEDALSALYTGAARAFLGADAPKPVDRAGAAALCREYTVLTGGHPVTATLAALERALA